jgi:hypothetical protein
VNRVFRHSLKEVAPTAANTLIGVEPRRQWHRPTGMSAPVYECIECEYREPADGRSRATFACPRCRGVMKRVGAA